MAPEPRISVIIPARNEAAVLPALLDSLRARLPPAPESEVIVVDNGSTDATAAVAEEAGARVVPAPGVTVAAMRNRGVAASRGAVLVFLDADMLVTPAWGTRLPAVAAALRADPDVITGSRAGIESPGSWIERAWFRPLGRVGSRYMNSGHLVTSAALFAALDGFDPGLETGEDADFGRRATGRGARIVDDPALAVIHRGYPKTLGAFVRREVWHGTGDAAPGRLLRSQVARIALGVVGLHVIAVAALIAGRPGVAALALAAVALACLGASAVRFRRERVGTRLVDAFLYYWYFLARGLSPLAAWLGARPRRAKRAA